MQIEVLVIRRNARVMVLAGLRPSDAQGAAAPNPANFVRTLLDAPAAGMDFGRAKLAIDKFVDPSTDGCRLAEIDSMLVTVKK
ncbi:MULTISPECIES: hypothetical protein [unclassified Mesorhizobium]|uniref:hypothetical protein n=1 Tax=unclassified Mesorhizobium TaxID=325217 RepID=UPI0015C9BFB6|nr:MULTISPECIES: hypothetical protein [unclassified Mesorhizobium]